MNNSFEHPINWRMVRTGFHLPNISIQVTGENQETIDRDLMVFVPQTKHLDIIAMRDWLEDSNNNVGGYRLVGCFCINSRDHTKMQGMKVSFSQETDAVYFRLCWYDATKTIEIN